MTTLQQAPPKAGWYPDPHDRKKLRWWNGRAWTSHITRSNGGPRQSRLGWLLSCAAILVVLVAMTLSSGLPARIAQSGFTLLSPEALAPALQTPQDGPEPLTRDTASVSDLATALQGVAMVKASCGEGCTSIGGAVAIGPTEFLTAEHVVAAGGIAMIVTESGDAMQAEVVATDEARDLALLRTGRPHGLPVGVLRTGDPVIGEEARAAGYPGGERRVSVGSVTAIVDLGSDGILEVQTDAAVDLGNSGGPLLDGEGRILGIVVQEHERDETIAWATGSTAVAEFLSEALLGDPQQSGAPSKSAPLPGSDDFNQLIDDLFDGLDETE